MSTQCTACGRRLTARSSEAVRMGPVCARRAGLHPDTGMPRPKARAGRAVPRVSLGQRRARRDEAQMALEFAA